MLKTLGGDMAAALMWAGTRARRFERKRNVRALGDLLHRKVLCPCPGSANPSDS